MLDQRNVSVEISIDIASSEGIIKKFFWSINHSAVPCSINMYTAIQGEDFTLPTQTVLFSINNPTPVIININNDVILESGEMVAFLVSPSIADASVVDISPGYNQSMLIIIDDDSKL